MIDIESFKQEGFAVYCENENEAFEFLTLCEQYDLCGNGYIESIPNDFEIAVNVCYRWNEEYNVIQVARAEYWEGIGVKVVEFHSNQIDISFDNEELLRSGLHMYDIEEFKQGNIAVQCRTKEDSKLFLCECREHHLNFCSGVSISDEIENSHWKGIAFCYYLCYMGSIHVGDIASFERKNDDDFLNNKKPTIVVYNNQTKISFDKEEYMSLLG
jgi:hypothetical protein